MFRQFCGVFVDSLGNSLVYNALHFFRVSACLIINRLILGRIHAVRFKVKACQHKHGKGHLTLAEFVFRDSAFKPTPFVTIIKAAVRHKSAKSFLCL